MKYKSRAKAIRCGLIIKIGKFLRPERFDFDPNSSDAEDHWIQWHGTNIFLTAIEALNLDKVDALTNFLPLNVYKYVRKCDASEDAVHIRENRHIK